MKISLIGMGRVGSTLGFALMVKGLADELVLVNRTPEVAVGETLDLSHASTLVSEPVQIHAGGIADTQQSDIIVMCTSVPLGPQHTTRHELAAGNVEIFCQYIPELVEHSPHACVLIITNPVDVMTYVAWKLSGLEPQRVFGTGTIIDSARFRGLLSQEVGIHPDDVRAYVLGEHGDTQFPALSLALSGGEWVGGHHAARRLFKQTVRSGYEVVQHKGHTNFAIALAARFTKSKRRYSRSDLRLATPRASAGFRARAGTGAPFYPLCIVRCLHEHACPICRSNPA